MLPLRPLLAAAAAALAVAAPLAAQSPRPAGPPRARARALGVAPGVFTPGALNAITDVAGVRVGQVTLTVGDSVRTGITAILPHAGNLFAERVPAAIVVGNGFGKLAGVTQVAELGELETPVVLTCTLCVWKAADALAGWMLERPGMEGVRSINPVVGETNDGTLNPAIRHAPIAAADVRRALETAASGPVAEGSVGAGAGTVAFGWKGGIGTSSRRLPASLGGWTVGVLVQTNFGGVLQVLGAPVGRELGRYAYKSVLDAAPAAPGDGPGDGSVMIVVATDAPLTDRALRRVASRALFGLARTGSDASNGSGDYVIAFATAAGVRRTVPLAAGNAPPPAAPPPPPARPELGNEESAPLFEAVIEATEEAIYNSLFMATTVTSRGGTVEAIPLDRVREVLRKYGITAPR